MNTNNFQIPFEDFGGDGPIIHFAHANGFPPKAYQKFIKPFTKTHKVIGMHGRPLWQEKPDSNSNWHEVAQDLIDFLDSQNLKNIIGMGHSMGGVATLFASVKRPDLFRKMVLIEPVFVAPKSIFMYQLVPPFLRKKMHPMIQGALKRQDVWANRETVFESWRKKRVFSKWSDEVLWDYINAGTKPTETGKVTLSYSKFWEANYYSKVPKVWKALKKSNIPMMGIRGAKSNTILPEAWKLWQKHRPGATFLEVENSGHLVPMEKPTEISKAILDYLKSK